MATHNTLNELFTDIADAIREKNGETSSIVADNFPTEIREISTGIEPPETVSVQVLNAVSTLPYTIAYIGALTYTNGEYSLYTYGTFGSSAGTNDITIPNVVVNSILVVTCRSSVSTSAYCYAATQIGATGQVGVFQITGLNSSGIGGTDALIQVNG